MLLITRPLDRTLLERRLHLLVGVALDDHPAQGYPLIAAELHLASGAICLQVPDSALLVCTQAAFRQVDDQFNHIRQLDGFHHLNTYRVTSRTWPTR